jgi:hypothetical protein
MRPHFPRPLSRIAAVLSAVLGVVALSLSVVAGSDFVQRDCHNIPRSGWRQTSNCVDAYDVMMGAGVVGAFCILVFCWSLWSLRHV